MNTPEYDLKARLFPSMICALPLFVLYHFYLWDELKKFIDLLAKAQWLYGTSSITVYLIFVFFLSQINRIIAKDFFEKKVFNQELDMPTTNNLLYTHKIYSDQYIDRIHKKIYTDFKIKLLNKRLEVKNFIKAKELIVDAVSLIRSKVKNGRLLLKHNIEYGFFRNLIGGSTISAPLTFFILILFIFKKNNTAFIISIFLLVFYSLVLLFNKKILITFGNLYAKILIQEYMYL